MVVVGSLRVLSVHCMSFRICCTMIKVQAARKVVCALPRMIWELDLISANCISGLGGLLSASFHNAQSSR